MKETAKAHQGEECAANCRHVCAGSDHRERRQSGSSLREFDDAFDMSQGLEPTRTTEQKERSSQGSHNESARGVRHEIVVSVVPACSDTRVCHEQGREDSTGSADRSIKSAELVERCPLTTRRLVKRLQ